MVLAVLIGLPYPVWTFIITVIGIVFWWINYSRKQKIYDKLPGPRPWPIIGNMDILFSREKSAGQAMHDNGHYFADLYRNEGLFCLFVGPKPIVYLFSPE